MWIKYYISLILTLIINAYSSLEMSVLLNYINIKLHQNVFLFAFICQFFIIIL